MTDTLSALAGLAIPTIFVLVLLAEWLTPLQRSPTQIVQRWVGNGVLFILVEITLLVLMPGGLQPYLDAISPNRLGLQSLPLPMGVLLTILLLDAWRYWEHRIFHSVPFLWRLHLVHHSDTQVDITTTERHHPLDAVVGGATAVIFVLVFFPPLEGLLAYYILVRTVQLCAHANLALPTWLDRSLGMVLVTPGQHAIHHSPVLQETNSNYGALSSVWDRLFGTFTDPAITTHKGFGLEYFRDHNSTSAIGLLLQPFRFSTAIERQSVTASPTPTIVISEDWKRALLYLALAAFCLLAIYRDAIESLWMILTSASEWQFAVLVIPTFAYLVFAEYREELFNYRPHPSLAAIPLALLAAALFTMADLMAVNVFAHAALLIAIQACLLGVLGTRLYLRFLPLWGFLFMLFPYDGIAMPVLRDLTAWSIQAMAGLTGIAYSASGFLITFGSKHYQIVPACSGMQYFTLSVFLGYALGLVMYRRWLPIGLVTLTAGILAILANMVRVNVIVAMDYVSGTQSSLDTHQVVYWFVLAGLLGSLLWALTRLSPSSKPEAQHSLSDEAVASGSLLPLALTVSLCATPVLALSSAERLVDAPQLRTPPAEIFQRGVTHVDTEVRDGSYVRRTLYGDEADLLATVELWPLSDTRKHDLREIVPDVTRAWRLQRQDLRQPCADCEALYHSVWTAGSGKVIYNVYAAYVINGRTSSSALAFRAHRGWSRLTGDVTQHLGMVAVVSDAPVEELEEVNRTLQQLAALRQN